MKSTLDLARYHQCIDAAFPIQAQGRVVNIVGLVVEARGPVSSLGSVCEISGGDGHKGVAAEVLGFRDNRVLMMPLEEIRGIGPGCRVVAKQEKAVIGVGPGLLGRVIDGLGQPIDGRGPIEREADR